MIGSIITITIIIVIIITITIMIGVVIVVITIIVITTAESLLLVFSYPSCSAHLSRPRSDVVGGQSLWTP